MKKNTIETRRLILRHYKMSDLNDYWEYVSNKNIGPRIGWDPYTSMEKAKERLAYECKNLNNYAITLKENNKVIGSIEIRKAEKEKFPGQKIDETDYSIGFMLSEKYWGLGIMPEATRAILKYAFETLKASNVLISHVEANTNSARVQDKVNFRIVGRVKNYRNWIDGKPTDLIIRKMTKNEWDASNK